MKNVLYAGQISNLKRVLNLWRSLDYYRRYDHSTMQNSSNTLFYIFIILVSLRIRAYSFKMYFYFVLNSNF